MPANTLIYGIMRRSANFRGLKFTRLVLYILYLPAGRQVGISTIHSAIYRFFSW